MSDSKHLWMAQALRLARRGLDTTSPNPRVGCVIVDGDRLVSEGFHQRAGEPHAEVLALEAAGNRAKGATAYVTLEPCAHVGRTGPCAQALIDAGIARVVYGMEDPNPQVSGSGLAILRDAGVVLEGPVMENQARALNPGFIKRMNEGLPWVRCKMAMSIDGRTAMASGESKWVTGPAAREDVQRWRARSCAMVTGVGSVLHDDPALTVRLDGAERQPLRVIVDSHARCPAGAAVYQQGGQVVLAVGEGAVPQSQAQSYWSMPLSGSRIDLRALLKKLADKGCNEVMIEAGATLSGAFVAAGLVDEYILYMAPKLMGSSARPLFSLPIDTMNGHLALVIEDMRPVGDDWRLIARPDPDA